MESIYKDLLPATHLSINISTISENNTRQIELFAQGEHYEQIKEAIIHELLLIDTLKPTIISSIDAKTGCSLAEIIMDQTKPFSAINALVISQSFEQSKKITAIRK